MIKDMVSIIVPCRNEADNIVILVDEISAAFNRFANNSQQFEVIVVDDGSNDDTCATVKRLMPKNKWLRLINHDKSSGQSAAIFTGIWQATGEYVAVIDGDGQNDPKYLPDMLAMLQAERHATSRGIKKPVGMVAGQRQKRTDSNIKKYGSRLANRIRRSLLDDEAKDSSCGMKALPTALYRRLPYFDGWHRFMPALVKREGYKVLFVDVTDRSRISGRSNYGIFDRLRVTIIDLFGVWWLVRRRNIIPAVTETLPEGGDKARA